MAATHWEARPGKCWNVTEVEGKILSHVLITGWLGTHLRADGLGDWAESPNFWMGAEPKDAPAEQSPRGPQSSVPGARSHSPATP